jgi:hypothetical protein
MDARLAIDSPDVAWCLGRWNRPANRALRAMVVRLRLLDRAYVYRLDEGEAETMTTVSAHAGECATTFLRERGDEYDVRWFLERRGTGRFRAVDELNGPVVYVLPGNAVPQGDATLVPVAPDLVTGS